MPIQRNPNPQAANRRRLETVALRARSISEGRSNEITPDCGKYPKTKRIAATRKTAIWPSIGQFPFGVRPDGFDWVELTRRRWQRFEVETSIPTTEISNWLTEVTSGVVPDHDDVAAQMA